MLRQGLFAADILYFCGETVPNFTLINRKPIPGFDYDVINAQALLSRAGTKDGRVTLLDGMSYRYLVIPEGIGTEMTIPVLEKITRLVEGGATLVGVPPKHTPGLKDFQTKDAELKKLRDTLWGHERVASGTRTVGKGRVIWGTEVADVIKADGLAAACDIRGVKRDAKLDWIHRRLADADLFFVANGGEQPVEFEAAFRVENKAPELWDPVIGEIRELPNFETSAHQSVIPNAPRSVPELFHRVPKNASGKSGTQEKNFPTYKEVTSLRGPWEIAFDPAWGGPAKVTFDELDDWSKRPEDGIRYYSGTAVYRKKFDLTGEAHGKLCIDLGTVKNLAQVRLNGKELGVVWTDPWRIVIDGVVYERENELEIEVVNLWPNKLIGDGKLPKEQRRTVTNVHTYDAALPTDLNDFGCPICEERKKTGKQPELLSSGMLGPVRILREV